MAITLVIIQGALWQDREPLAEGYNASNICFGVVNSKGCLVKERKKNGIC